MAWKNFKPPSGRPAGGGPPRGEGWGGPAKGAKGPYRPPTGDEIKAGKMAAKTARELAVSVAEEMAELMRDIARDKMAPLQTRLDAANKLIERAEGKPGQPVTGAGEGPIRVVWEDGE